MAALRFPSRTVSLTLVLLRLSSCECLGGSSGELEGDRGCSTAAPDDDASLLQLREAAAAAEEDSPRPPPPPPSGVQNLTVSANGYAFDCLRGGPAAKKGNVMLLHGFPEAAAEWVPLMEQLAARGLGSLACNQRGYSPGAAPDSVAKYDTRLLVSDIFAFADALKWGRFHVVGTDFGGALGWVVAATPPRRVLSFSSLNLPHLDAFSAGLFGPAADFSQQALSQYITMFILPDSATLHDNFMFKAFGAGIATPAELQRRIWWYNGVIQFAGLLATPPVLSEETLTAKGFTQSAQMRAVFGGTPNAGAPQQRQVGDIHVPVLFVCPSKDAFILCNHPYALETKSYVKKGYDYLEVDCGHFLLRDCANQSEVQKIFDHVIQKIESS